MVTQCIIVTLNMTKVPPSHIDLHLQIRAKRRELDIKQESLAEMSGLSLSFISKVEGGKFKDIGIDSLRKISQALNYYEWDLGLIDSQL